MKMNKLIYLVKEGIRGIFLHGFASTAAIGAMVACLLIVGGFFSISQNLGIIVQDLNKTNEVLVYVDENYTDAEARSVGTLINKVENVYKSTFVSREQALEDFVADHGGSDAFSGLEAETFRHRFVVQLKDNSQIEATVQQLEQIPGVAKINAAFALAEGFSSMQRILEIVSYGVLIVLGIVSALIMSNTVKLAMNDRRDEISIMKMVGATNRFIRLPYVVEGCILGTVGAGIAFGLLWLLYEALAGRLAATGSLSLFEFVPFTELMPVILPIFLIAGLAVGVLSSCTSIKKYMDV